MAIEFHRDGPWDLPEGWVWARLRHLISFRGEKAPPDRTSPFPFIGMDDVPPNSLRIETMRDFRAMKSAGNKFYPNDILYGRLRPYLNKVVVADLEGVASGEFIVMHAPDGIEPRYLQLFMHGRRFVNLATADTSGDRPRIDFNKIADIEVPLAPTAEQRRIVARLDELFTEIADGEAALARARADLGTWRRALLKAAVTGELTREWRERNKPNESGKDVSARVARARIGYKTTKARGRKLVVEDVVEDSLPEIPDTWAWASLGELGDIVGGITVDKKRRPIDPVTVPYLRVANVQRGRLDLTQVKTISVDRSDADALYLQPGDILLNEGGDRDKIGRGWVWNDEIDHCIHQNHVFRVRLFDHGVNPYFISHFANEMGRRFFVEKGKQTTNLASISMSKISQLRIPVPPTAEVDEVMRLLDDMLAATVDVEAELNAASISDAERQSILKAAFEGHLVEQDLRDESANRLLIRLSGQSETQVSMRRTNRRAGIAAE